VTKRFPEPQQQEKDPVVGTTVTVANDRPPKIEVIHRLASGEIRRRNDQYRDIKTSVRTGEDSVTWSWTGILATNTSLSMKGELSGGEGQYSYSEQMTANGKLDWAAVWSCHEQDSPAPGPNKQGTTGSPQRAVLYEESPSNPNGDRFVSSVIWRTETVTSGPGQPPELAIRADIEVPERKLAMTWVLRRNTDKGLPASHTVEIMCIWGHWPGSWHARPSRFKRKRLSGSRTNLPTCFSRLNSSTHSVYLLFMQNDVSDEPAPQKCHICEAPMVLMSTLAAIGTFPMQRIYKCTACKFTTAETVKTPFV
jgi:hypothetical protein